MRPAVSGLTAGVLSGGLGQGVQLFKEPMDLPFVESGVPLQLSFRRLHLLPVFAMSGIFIATERKTPRSFMKAPFLDLLCMCACVRARYLS